MHASKFFKFFISYFELQALWANIKSPQRELILKLEVDYTSNYWAVIGYLNFRCVHIIKIVKTRRNN